MTIHLCRSRGSTRKERGAYITAQSLKSDAWPSKGWTSEANAHTRQTYVYISSTTVEHTLSYTSMSQRLLNSVVVLHHGSTNSSLTRSLDVGSWYGTQLQKLALLFVAFLALLLALLFLDVLHCLLTLVKVLRSSKGLGEGTVGGVSEAGFKPQQGSSVRWQIG